MFDPSTLDTRPKRASVQDAEWQLTAQLVRNGEVIEGSTVELRITDARLNTEPFDTGWHVALWMDDMAQKRARRESAQKKARKK